LLRMSLPLDILARGIPDVGVPLGQLRWITKDSVSLQDVNLSVSDQLELQVTEATASDLDHVGTTGTLNAVGTVYAYNKAKEHLAAPQGTVWTLEADDGQVYTISRSPSEMLEAVSIQPEFAALLGGTEAGTKVTATKALVEELGLALAGAAGPVMRQLPASLQLLARSKLQLDRLLVRLATLFVGLLARSQSLGKGYRLAKVNPPAAKKISAPVDLFLFCSAVEGGEVGYFLHPHRAETDNWTIAVVLMAALADSIRWPGKPLVVDQLWPELTTGNSALGYCDGMTMPGAAAVVTPGDVLTAAECILADLTIDISRFEKIVDTVLLLGAHQQGGSLLGLAQQVELQLPVSRLDALALTPLLRKGDPTRPTLSKLRGNWESLLWRAFARADVLVRAWWCVRDTLCHGPNAINPLVQPAFEQLLRSSNGMREVWQYVTAACKWLGHDGALGAMVCSAVPRTGGLNNRGVYYGLVPNIRVLHACSTLGVLVSPPPLFTELNKAHGATHAGHIQLALLLANHGSGTGNEVLAENMLADQGGSLRAVQPYVGEHDGSLAKAGLIECTPIVRCRSMNYYLQTGPAFEFRESTMRWYWDWAAGTPNLYFTTYGGAGGNVPPPPPQRPVSPQAPAPPSTPPGDSAPPRAPPGGDTGSGAAPDGGGGDAVGGVPAAIGVPSTAAVAAANTAVAPAQREEEPVPAAAEGLPPADPGLVLGPTEPSRPAGVDDAPMERSPLDLSGMLASARRRAAGEAPDVAGEEDIDAEPLLPELASVVDDELTEPSVATGEDTAVLFGGQALADATAAQGIVAAISGVRIDWAMKAVEMFGSERAMTLAMAYSTTGSRSEALERLVTELDEDASDYPLGVVTTMRRQLRDYLRESGQKRDLGGLTPEERTKILGICDRIKVLRKKPVTPGGRETTQAMINRGPFAAMGDCQEAARQRHTRAREWLIANGATYAARKVATLGPESLVVRPAPRVPDAEFSVDIEGVTYSNVPDVEHDVILHCVDCAWGTVPLLSKHGQPGEVWCVDSGKVMLVNTRRSDRLEEVGRTLGTTDCMQVWLSDSRPPDKLINSLHRAMLTSKKCNRVFVPGLAANSPMLARLTNQADARRKYDESKGGGRKPDEAGPSGAGPGGGTEESKEGYPSLPHPLSQLLSRASLGTDPRARGQVLDWLQAWLNYCGWTGGYSLRRMTVLADICFQLAPLASTRAEHVRCTDIGLGLATLIDAGAVWVAPANDDLEAHFKNDASSACFDVPRLDLDRALAAGVRECHLKMPIKERHRLNSWRSGWLRRHGRLAACRLSNIYRAILDDEKAAVNFSSRYICATGDLTPMEWVRSRILVANRGCGDGRCWCTEPAPTTVDRSRSTGPGPPLPLRQPCAKDGDSHSVRWLRAAVWRGYRHSVPLDELALLPGAARVETFRAVLEDMDLTPTSWEDYDVPQENMQLGGVPVQCTKRMAEVALRDKLPKHWYPTCNGPPQAHCGFMLWAGSLSPHLREELQRWQLHSLPMKAWKTWSSDCGPLVRRAAMVGRLKGEEWLQMRKVANVCVRRATRADMEAERLKRTTMPVMKTSLTGDFEYQWKALFRQIAGWQTVQVSRRGDFRTIKEEWALRSAVGPTGSSSCGALLRGLGRDSVHAESIDRPNKKAALSAVASGWLQEAVDSVPVNIARSSTKPEPGDKPRALFSSGDLTTFVASYALRGFEGSANYGGMAASQRPEVIGKWIMGTYNAHVGVQVSADLDDQNWQHEMWELAHMWDARADAFIAMPGAEAADKAAACLFVAKAFERSIVIGPDGLWRAIIGLYSGHRGTTQDNTADHEADRTLCNQQAISLGVGGPHNDVTESGDDEWLWQETWGDAVGYLACSKMMGVRMNAMKQLVGRAHGEYLQRCVSDEAPPRQSLATILATLTTGNWYQPSGTWLNAIIEAQCANWLEACVRGLNRTVACRMCSRILDQVFVLREEGRPRLEWRSYVMRYSSGRRLFEGAPGFGAAVPPDPVVRLKPEPQWDTQGFSDYKLTPQYKWIARSLGKQWLVAQFDDSIKLDAMSSTRARWERDRVAETIAKRWPLGAGWVEIDVELPNLRPPPGLTQTAMAWARAQRRGRVVTEEDNMAAMGLGGREAQLLGGYELLLREAPPELLCKVRPIRRGPELVERIAVDTGILSGLMLYSSHAPEFGLQLPPPRARSICVVAAPHGAGVSRLARRFSQRTAVRLDRLARGLCGDLAYHRPSDCKSHDLEVYRDVERCVAQALASGYRPDIRVLLTHTRPRELVDALQSQGIQAHWVLYSPDEATRAKRIAARNVNAAILRYMAQTWCDLYATEGARNTQTDEDGLIQYVTQEV